MENLFQLSFLLNFIKNKNILLNISQTDFMLVLDFPNFLFFENPLISIQEIFFAFRKINNSKSNAMLLDKNFLFFRCFAEALNNTLKESFKW